MKTVRLFLWAAVVLGLVFAGSRFLSDENTEARGPGGPFVLTSHTGETVSNTQFLGKFMLVYFGYSFCPDVCPVDMYKLTVAMEMLEKDGFDTSPIQPIFISVDPERDTPEQLASFVEDFHPSLIALTGTEQEIAAAAENYKVYYAKREVEGLDSYLMDHQAVIFVMDQDGVFNRLITRNHTPDDIAELFKTVLDKQSATGR